MGPPPTLDVRRGASRFTTEGTGTTSRHAFSFGRHYDPDDAGFGVLAACNEELLQPGAGFPAHRHAGVEIVTWVLAGELTHADSAGGSAVLRPGQVAHLRTGSGVEHAETAEGSAPVRFLQMWLAAADAAPHEPALHVHDAPDDGGRAVVTTVGGLGRPDADLHVVRMDPGARVHVPAPGAAYAHVCRGAVGLAGRTLAAGDAARVVGAAAGLDLAGLPEGGRCEVVVWTMPPPARA